MMAKINLLPVILTCGAVATIARIGTADLTARLVNGDAEGIAQASTGSYATAPTSCIAASAGTNRAGELAAVSTALLWLEHPELADKPSAYTLADLVEAVEASKSTEVKSNEN
jgi:hypothetical protein